MANEILADLCERLLLETNRLYASWLELDAKLREAEERLDWLDQKLRLDPANCDQHDGRYWLAWYTTEPEGIRRPIREAIDRARTYSKETRDD